MRAIPTKMRERIAEDLFMESCIHPDCPGKPEWEHAFLYKGQQINEPWAIVPVCEYHHRGAGLNKDFNRFHAIIRAREEDFAKYPRTDWKQLKKFYVGKFGTKT